MTLAETRYGNQNSRPIARVTLVAKFLAIHARVDVVTRLEFV